MNGSSAIVVLTLCFLIVSESIQFHEIRSYVKTALRFRRDTDSDGSSCTLPPYPENGRWNLLNGNGQPGGQISFNSVIQYECDKGYKLTSGSQYRVCNKDWNDSSFRECEKLCPPLHSTPKISLKCMDKWGNSTSCQEATDGSFLTYTCAKFYETPFGYKKTILCLDGSWISPQPVCQPVCGKKIDDDNIPLIYGGETKNVIEYPWIIAVYSKKGDDFVNVCGGTIISQKIVLTAAHCVTNGYGDVMPKEKYRVGAGKLYNTYNDSRDPDAQHLEISRIIIHSGYKGENRRFQADIALLVTNESFILNEWVQPVCFNDVNTIHLHAGYTGVVAGWGATENGLRSDKLKILEIPYKYETTCAQELPREWANKYAMIDKICAGFFNMSMAVCKGDSGGGLVFKNPEDNRFYVHGVVSIGPAEKGECNIQQNSLYTKVAFYYEFLEREISKSSLIDECTLPAYPKNGKWVVQDTDRQPGDIVSLNTMLKYSCDEGFELSTDSPDVKCNSSLSSITCSPLYHKVNDIRNINTDIKKVTSLFGRLEDDVTVTSMHSYTAGDATKPAVLINGPIEVHTYSYKVDGTDNNKWYIAENTSKQINETLLKEVLSQQLGQFAHLLSATILSDPSDSD